MQETKKCPNCDYEGLMQHYTVIETKETYFKCQIVGIHLKISKFILMSKIKFKF